MAHLHLVYVNRVLQDVISRLQLLIYPVSVIIDIQGGGGTYGVIQFEGSKLLSAVLYS